MSANAAVKSVNYGRKGPATVLLGGSPLQRKGKSGHRSRTARKRQPGCLGRGARSHQNSNDRRCRVGLRLVGIAGQSGGRSNRSFMRWHDGNCWWLWWSWCRWRCLVPERRGRSLRGSSPFLHRAEWSRKYDSGAVIGPQPLLASKCTLKKRCGTVKPLTGCCPPPRRSRNMGGRRPIVPHGDGLVIGAAKINC